jgi:hypothetical protein
MTQQQLNREVARRTGETIDTVRRIGFGLDRPGLDRPGAGRSNLGRKLRLESRRRRLRTTARR